MFFPSKINLVHFITLPLKLLNLILKGFFGKGSNFASFFGLNILIPNCSN